MNYKQMYDFMLKKHGITKQEIQERNNLHPVIVLVGVLSISFGVKNQELADLTGKTVQTVIRWVNLTKKDYKEVASGFKRQIKDEIDRRKTLEFQKSTNKCCEEMRRHKDSYSRARVLYNFLKKNDYSPLNLQQLIKCYNHEN